MGAPAYSQGEILLAWLVFSGGQGAKRRPVLVVHDFGDGDLLVVPVTSHPARTERDVILRDWRAAGLKLPSTVRVEKLATIQKSCVARRLGRLTEGMWTGSSKSWVSFAGSYPNEAEGGVRIPTYDDYRKPWENGNRRVVSVGAVRGCLFGWSGKSNCPHPEPVTSQTGCKCRRKGTQRISTRLRKTAATRCNQTR